MRRIEIGVTHEIKIGRESAWVKYGVAEDVPDESDLDVATDALTKYVADKVLNIVEQTVAAVEKFEETR